MYSTTSSIQNFIENPNAYHLKLDGTSIIAVPGSAATDERVHQTALTALNSLATPSHTAGGAASTSAPTSVPKIIEQCKTAEFTRKIHQWAHAEDKHPSENRIEAAKLIIGGAYTKSSNTLNLANLNLRSLPPEIGQLTGLTLLSLDNNQLSTLPPEIGQLTGLQCLYLSDNQLSTLPPEIGQLTGLTELGLYNNQLSTLPPEIGQLTNLTCLSLIHNQLTTLPPEIGQLTGLMSLYLSCNQLITLPQEIGQLTNLENLCLENNPINGNGILHPIAACPSLLNLPYYHPDRGRITPQTLLEICQRNGLALEFIPDTKKTAEIVNACLKQNGMALQWVPRDLISYENAVLAVTSNPKATQFVPKDVIDLTRVLEDIKTQHALLGLVALVAPEAITYEIALAGVKTHPLLLKFVPAQIQILDPLQTDRDNSIILLALKDPEAFNFIDPAQVTEELIGFVITIHEKTNKEALKKALGPFAQQLREKKLNPDFAYYLAQLFNDDKPLILSAINHYAIPLSVANENLRADEEIVRLAITHNPSELKDASEALKNDPELIAYAEERKIALEPPFQP